VLILLLQFIVVTAAFQRHYFFIVWLLVYSCSFLVCTQSPGHYFLKPMMKEYNFQPSSQMIEVVEGVTVNVAITGKRVAFRLDIC